MDWSFPPPASRSGTQYPQHGNWQTRQEPLGYGSRASGFQPRPNDFAFADEASFDAMHNRMTDNIFGNQLRNHPPAYPNPSPQIEMPVRALSGRAKIFLALWVQYRIEQAPNAEFRDTHVEHITRAIDEDYSATLGFISSWLGERDRQIISTPMNQQPTLSAYSHPISYMPGSEYYPSTTQNVPPSSPRRTNGVHHDYDTDMAPQPQTAQALVASRVCGFDEFDGLGDERRQAIKNGIKHAPIYETRGSQSRCQLVTDKSKLHKEEGMTWQCTCCAKGFDQKKSWKRHEAESNPDRLWVCLLGRTMLKDGRRCCSYCGKVVPPDTNAPFSCCPRAQSIQICSSGQARNSGRKEHFKQHCKYFHRHLRRDQFLELADQSEVQVDRDVLKCRFRGCSQEFNDWDTGMDHISHHFESEKRSLEDWEFEIDCEDTPMSPLDVPDWTYSHDDEDHEGPGDGGMSGQPSGQHGAFPANGSHTGIGQSSSGTGPSQSTTYGGGTNRWGVLYPANPLPALPSQDPASTLTFFDNSQDSFGDGEGLSPEPQEVGRMRKSSLISCGLSPHGAGPKTLPGKPESTALDTHIPTTPTHTRKRSTKFRISIDSALSKITETTKRLRDSVMSTTHDSPSTVEHTTRRSRNGKNPVCPQATVSPTLEVTVPVLDANATTAEIRPSPGERSLSNEQLSFHIRQDEEQGEQKRSSRDQWHAASRKLRHSSTLIMNTFRGANII